MAPKSNRWIAVAGAMVVAAGASMIQPFGAATALAQARGAAPAQGRGAAPAPSATGIPRMPDGKPDFNGYWQAVTSAAYDIEPHSARPGIPAGQGIIDADQLPYLPAAAAKKKQNAANPAADPVEKCYLPGVPRIMYMPFPFQIFQTPEHMSMLFEWGHAIRDVYLNGSQHPKGHIDWWMGDSRGRWEGDTLVVDVVDFNEETWFDHAGNHHSDALHLVERYTFAGPDHITYEVTVEDPKVFSRPWKMSTILYRHKEKPFQLLEYECNALAEGAF
jgi:hypothetical protein